MMNLSQCEFVLALLCVLCDLCGNQCRASLRQSNNFQQLHGRPFADEDLRSPAIDRCSAVNFQMLSQQRSGLDLPERDQFHFTQHVMLDQHASQGRSFAVISS